jgi:hypothetical protein
MDSGTARRHAIGLPRKRAVDRTFATHRYGLECSTAIATLLLSCAATRAGYSVALFTFYYNFVRLHKTLRLTPAMAAGVTEKLWEMSDVVKLIEDMEAKRVEHKKLTASRLPARGRTRRNARPACRLNAKPRGRSA